MREIKFRAYDPETEEWYYSDKEYDDHWFEFKEGKLICFGVSENPGTIHEPPYPESYECEDVKEYVGRGIYEGDIVVDAYASTKPGVICYNESYFAIYIPTNIKGSELETVLGVDFYPVIIGNETENPELLEGI